MSLRDKVGSVVFTIILTGGVVVIFVLVVVVVKLQSGTIVVGTAKSKTFVL